jgi:DNA-directed RNA polymerase subunit RPC12/RpoP
MKRGIIMNLKELKETIDFVIGQLRHDYEKPEQIPVLINLSENSIGARASSGVNYACMGIDWEHGQFRLQPSKSLVSKGNALTDVKEVVRKEFEGRAYYFCPRCGDKIAKDDYYCRYCGQKLK